MPLEAREVEQLLTQAQTKLTGASTAGLKTELFAVLKEFFEDSNSWTEDIPFQVVAHVRGYNLTPREDGQIIRLVGVWDHKGFPYAAFMHNFAELHLRNRVSFTPPDKWFARVIKTVVMPTTNNDVPIAPDWTLRVYSQHILDGLLGRMMAEPQKSYTNPTQSTYHLRRFRTGIQIARDASRTDNLFGGQAWSFPALAGGSQRGGGVWPGRPQ